MKRYPYFALITISAAFSLQSCCDKKDDYSMDNQTFVTKASSSNSLEIAAGTLAQTKAVRVDVIAYGKHMLMDHGTITAEMMNLAGAKGWGLATELQVKDQVKLDRLIAATASTFDTEFANVMVSSHEDAVNLFTTGAGNGGVRDGDLRNYAASKLPALKAHLTEANALQAAVKP